MISVIRLCVAPGPTRRGWLLAGQARFRCVIGRSGVVRAKREGDGGTPAASMPLRRLWWRADRGPRPHTALPARVIRAEDGWCDAPPDRNYNRPVRLPYPVSHETLFRCDALYDLVVELGWNDGPRRKGAGSAIFLHQARRDWTPTEGCIALQPRDLRKLLTMIGPRTRIVTTL